MFSKGYGHSNDIGKWLYLSGKPISHEFKMLKY